MPSKNLEVKRRASKRYAERHPDRVRISQKIWKSKNPEKLIGYRKKHRKKRIVQTKTWRERNQEKVKEYRTEYNLRKYGLTLEAYENMLNLQNGVCAICKMPPNKKRLHVDHDHTTGAVRGILCSPCNTAIGLFKDNPKLMNVASEYVSGKR